MGRPAAASRLPRRGRLERSSWTTHDEGGQIKVRHHCENGDEEDAFLRRYGGRLRGGSSCSSASADGGVEPRSGEDRKPVPDLAALRAGLVQGLTVFEGVVEGGHYLPVFYTLKDGLHLGPAELSLIMGLSSIPWFCKPLLAVLTDRFPLGGGLRSPYLTAGFLTVGGSFVALTLVDSYARSLLLLSLNTLGRCLVGVVLQALVVELARPEGRGGASRVVGDFFLMKTAGALAGVLCGSRLLSAFGPQPTLRFAGGLLPAAMLFAVARYELIVASVVAPPTTASAATDAAPALVSASASAAGSDDEPLVASASLGEANEAFRVQPPHTPNANLSSLLPQLISVFSQPAVWGPLAFLLLYSAGPGYDSSLFYFYVDRLQFSPSVLGWLRVMQEVSKLLGIILYRYGLRHLPDRYFLIGVTTVSFPLYLAPLLLTTGAYKELHLEPKMLALSGELVRETFLHLQYMPAFSRAVEVCPAGLEGTVSALVASSIHVSRGFSLVGSAALATSFGVSAQDFSHLSPLIIACGCASLAPLAVIGSVPHKGVLGGADASDGEGNVAAAEQEIAHEAVVVLTAQRGGDPADVRSRSGDTGSSEDVNRTAPAG